MASAVNLDDHSPEQLGCLASPQSPAQTAERLRSLKRLIQDRSENAWEPSPELREKLILLVQEQLRKGSPPRFEWPQPAPVVRRWAPAGAPDCSRARVIAARQELGLHVKELESPRINRSASEGWRGTTYSYKADANVNWNGRLVEAAILEADADASVTRLIGGPLKLKYLSQNGWRERSPHLLVVRAGVPWLIDCFWDDTASRPLQAQRWRNIGLGCASIGLGYEVLTERHLERRQRMRNVEAICRSRTDDLPSTQVQAAAIKMIGQRPTTLIQCCRQLDVPRSAIFRMVLGGLLAVDLELSLDQQRLALGPRALS